MSAAALPVAWSVAELTRQIQGTLQRAFGVLWLEGEVSNFSRSGAGHAYWTLKDDQAQIRVVCWRRDLVQIPFELTDGLHVLLEGTVDVYAARGQYQFTARRAIPKGIGPLELAFRQLRDRLTAEGLFHPERKRPIPRHPARIALVTSPSGAAVRDFLEVACRRGRVDIVVVPALVQGDGAPSSLIAAIAAAASITGVEVIALVRGGGSLEDLWAFNNELLARAIAGSPIPVVTGVGHEVDLTIADLVADLRALTPSEAAERIVPDAAEWRRSVDRLGQRIASGLAQRWSAERRRWELLTRAAAFCRPLARLTEARRRLDDLERQLVQGITRRLERAEHDLEARAGAFAALDPLAILGRGYSLTTDRQTGKILSSVRAARAGQEIQVRLADGALACRIVSLEESP